jgi:hypothetical protein
MVIPYGEVGAQWWDAHFLSLDYGFGKSSASAHLHVRTQDGKIKTVREFMAPIRNFLCPYPRPDKHRYSTTTLPGTGFRIYRSSHCHDQKESARNSPGRSRVGHVAGVRSTNISADTAVSFLL